MARLFVDHLPCCNVEHKTWGVAVLLSFDALLFLVSSLSGLTLSRHLGASRVVLRDRFTVAALEAVTVP